MKQKRFAILLSIFGALILVAVVTSLTENKKDAGNFRSELVDFTADEATKVQFYPFGENAFRIEKGDDEQWFLQVDGKKYNGEKRAVDQLLSEVTGMKAQQVVSRDKAAWGDYSVDDSSAVRVQVFDGDKSLADFYVGRMDFGQPRNQYQQQPDMFTYVRLDKSSDVYKVRGMLSMMVREGEKSFRSGTISSCTENELVRVEYSYPADSSFSIVRQDSKWMIDGIAPDSAQLAKYINVVENFTNRNIVEQDTPAKQPDFSISLSGPDMQTIKIESWQQNEDAYLVQSTTNPGTLFNLNKSQFTRLFKGKNYFFQTTE